MTVMLVGLSIIFTQLYLSGFLGIGRPEGFNHSTTSPGISSNEDSQTSLASFEAELRALFLDAPLV